MNHPRMPWFMRHDGKPPQDKQQGSQPRAVPWFMQHDGKPLQGNLQSSQPRTAPWFMQRPE